MSYSAIAPVDLLRWCSISAEELPHHPAAKVRLRILPTAAAVAEDFAQELFNEVRTNNAKGLPTRWILPCGPTDQYPIFIRWINESQTPLRDVHIFHMDEPLDWQGRPLPEGDTRSYRNWMLRYFYAEIDADLNVPDGQRHFPSPFDLDCLTAAIDAVGGIDTAYGGIGYHGHVAYNEPPNSPWYSVSPADFRASKTRVLHLNDDTLIALSQRNFGGCSQMVPPMAVTIGMADILRSRRIRLYSTTGDWKRTVVRVAVFGPVTPEYPVTFCQEHPDCVIAVDRATAEAPL